MWEGKCVLAYFFLNLFNHASAFPHSDVLILHHIFYSVSSSNKVRLQNMFYIVEQLKPWGIAAITKAAAGGYY